MIPSQSHPINGGGRIDPVWLRWLAQLERGALAGKESGETNAEAIAAIATALGSPDGTVANIPDQSSGTSATITGQGPIEVTGSLASGSVTINGRSLTDSGEGTFKLLTRDSYGRVSGTADGAAADVPYDNTASGLAATEVQAAVDELAAEKLDDAPSDGSTYGRKNGAWAPIAGGGGGSTLVKKTADQARTSTTTLADDAELVSPLGAGSLYHIKVFVLFNQANAAMGIKFAFAYSGTLASDYYRGARASAGAAGGTDNEQTGSGSGAIGVTITQLSSASGIGYIQYDLILNTTTGGNFSFQWAQSTSAAAALTVLGGSYLEVTAF